MDQCAEGHALHEGGQQRAGEEAGIPPTAVARVAPAELERHTAEHEPQKHRDQRRVERRKDNRVSERESGEQPAATQHQPGLIAVPHRRDGIHRLIAVHSYREEREQDADSEVETVRHDISGDPEGNNKRPDGGEVHQRSSRSRPAIAGDGVIPAVRIGW